MNNAAKLALVLLIVLPTYAQAPEVVIDCGSLVGKGHVFIPLPNGKTGVIEVNCGTSA